MARPRKAGGKAGTGKRRVEQYDHKGQQRKNNPPVGLVTEATDRDAPKKQYAYDPHLDPTLTWAGTAEHTSFQLPTVSLHVHERIDPKTIMEAVRRRNGTPAPVQGSLFESPEENPPLREAIDFYQHAHAWSNRLIAGDSLLVMNSLLEKEGLAGKVQMVYIDPPYGIRYGSNFQPFVNKRDVKDGSDEDLTQEPEMIRAFRDTWELGIHSYLTYLRDRLLLARELLHESGSCFVQISDENLHLVQNLMDEVFGATNSLGIIPVVKTAGLGSTGLATVCDYLLWYARSKPALKYRQLYVSRTLEEEGATQYNLIELLDGSRRRMTSEERRYPSPSDGIAPVSDRQPHVGRL
jgi:adenine-specific DNA-methyltransferase